MVLLRVAVLAVLAASACGVATDRARMHHHVHRARRSGAEGRMAKAQAEATATSRAALSSMTTTEGGELAQNEAFSIILEKSSVSDMERSQFLMMLKAVRATLTVLPKGTEAREEKDSLLEEGNEPLQMQVLSEKRLATYFGKIQIGQCVDASKTKAVECSHEAKKKMTFKALFDTGSCEFWMPNEGCPKSTKPASRCEKHTLYHKSPTFLNKVDKAGPFNEDEKMCIQYLSGKIEGFMAKDTVRVGEIDVKEQVFGMADTIDVPLLDEVVWDGIVGLAYPNEKLQKSGVVPLFDNMMKSGIMKNNVFSYYIGASSGAVTFGGVDPAYFSSKGDDAQKFRYVLGVGLRTRVRVIVCARALYERVACACVHVIASLRTACTTMWCAFR